MGLSDDIIAIRRDLTRIALEHKERPPGEPRDDLLQRAIAAEKEARRLRNPQLVAVTLLQRAELLLAVDRVRDAISVLEQIKEDLGGCAKPTCRCGRSDILPTRTGGSRNGKACPTCATRASLWSRPTATSFPPITLASAYLRSRIGLYSWAVRAAYELKHYERAIFSAFERIGFKHPALLGGDTPELDLKPVAHDPHSLMIATILERPQGRTSARSFPSAASSSARVRGAAARRRRKRRLAGA